MEALQNDICLKKYSLAVTICRGAASIVLRRDWWRGGGGSEARAKPFYLQLSVFPLISPSYFDNINAWLPFSVTLTKRRADIGTHVPDL